MKRNIILLLFCCVITITLTAQQVVKRNRTTSASSNKHLIFEGLPIDGESNAFWDKMKRNGYSVKCEDEYCFNKYTEATIAGIQNWTVRACTDGIDEEYVYGVSITHEFARGISQLECYEKIKEYVESKYPITNTILYIGDNSLDDKDTETHYMIAGKGKIIVSYYSNTKGLHVKATFLDKVNEETIAIQSVHDYYELTLNQGTFEKCTIETSGNEIKYYVKSGNNVYRFLSRNDDKSLISQLLSGNYDNNMKILLMNSYIQKGIEKCKSTSAIPIIEKEFMGISNQYMASAKEQKGQAYTKPTSVKDAILEELRKMIFSPSERKVLDKVVPPEMMRQMMGGVLNVMGSSSSDSHYTDYEKYINPYVHD